MDLSDVTGSLNGSAILVVGASSGIGRAAAERLAADGASVMLAARGEERLETAASELRSAQPEARIATTLCDAMDGSSVAAAIESAAQLGPLSAIISIPGGGGFSPILDYDDEAFRDEITLNVQPTFHAIKYGGRALSHRGGSIVVVSSTSAVFSNRYLGAYCAAKAAVDQLVRVAADELGERGIRVNAVRPGLTKTGSTAEMLQAPGIADRFLAEQPIARIGESTDIADAIRYLAGPESSWVTGQGLTVDGGHTLRKFPDLGDLLGPPTEG
jgi:NAD(P)-dependent dehydrogenase (short-subunit alcohol dehydrogenase family)